MGTPIKLWPSAGPGLRLHPFAYSSFMEIHRLMVEGKAERDLVVIDRLRLASWLYVNNQRLVRRQIDALGQHVSYYFENSDEIDALVQQWVKREGLVDLDTLALFSESVSFEIRVAARLRRGEDASQLHLPRRLARRNQDNTKTMEAGNDDRAD